MKIAKLSVLRPVAMGMVICLVLILGIVSLRDLSVDLFPELSFPIVAVTASYEGAGPEEIEQLITQPIEEMMSSLPSVESVSSTSRTGGALILVAFDWGTDMDFATLNMRERIDMIREGLPNEVPTPQVLRFDPSLLPIVQLAVSAPDGNIIEARKLAENDISPLLDSVDGVASVQIEGGAEQEIQLHVDPNRLTAYGLTLTELQQIIASENLNLPGGQLQDFNLNLPIRITGQFTSIYDIKSLPVPTREGILPLSDIVHVVETLKPTTQASYLNGQPSVGISVLKASGTNTVAVARNINRQLEELEDLLPDGVEIRTIFDQSRFIEQSIRAVAWNIVLGSILAGTVLYLFLRNLRSTMIIGFSIPISIITTFLFMYFSGQTLNVLTLGGLALGVGMMVDNAIVILENIYRLRQKGMSIKDAAIEGTTEIGGAIIASTLTTIVVFLPIIFVDGLAAQLFKPLALTVAFSLFASLFTALIIVPLLSSTFMKVNEDSSFFQQGFQRLSAFYKKVLTKSLKRPKTVIIGTFALFAISFAGIPFIGTEFLPAQDQSFISIDTRLPAGSSLESTQEVANEIEERIQEIPEIDLIYVTVGGTDNFTIGAGTQTNRASYSILLKEPNKRAKSDLIVAEDIRNLLQDIPGAEISVSASDTGFTENPISITVKGRDLQTLNQLSNEVIRLISTVEGVREPSSNFTVGSPEITVTVDRERAANYGVGSAQIASAVNNATRGMVATRLARGGDELDVRLVVEERYTASVEELSQLLIDTPTGERIPLEAVATIARDQGPSTIRRADRLREVTVTASILNRDLGSVVNDIQDVLKEELAPVLPTGYRISFGGQNEQMNDAFFKLAGAIALAVVLVYMVMAARFESLFYPFIIMFSVPVTLIGIVFGLLVTFQPFGVGSLVGILILTGIVVNNAIVLIDYINTLKQKGLSSYDAIVEAGPTRLRPILMTALTTILGLIPLTLGFGEGTEIQQPMATVIVFGLSFSTFITLILIPVIYYAFDLRKQKKLLKKQEMQT
ncbi:efflux RND transporter permease subunit [Alkalihalobacterium chitinilyticum]|uniref:Efflux RND transporter permease subunit n=1 Tax=Alkalihalobacterium chitinilyticum TaxID=2980103 RepID=A0ABT5VBV5_9BACI|nr:efflux RND transporter permease subunit [Alkalihalobacterium chitinilyticum]MDE5412636.1 efflux RND transporter permease subunit [Alkalihalobacterium chitinilyticum]